MKVIKDRLKKSIGKRAEVFLNNGFRYFGIISNCDDVWLELFDFKIKGYKIIKIEDINNLDIYGEEENEKNKIL